MTETADPADGSTAGLLAQLSAVLDHQLELAKGGSTELDQMIGEARRLMTQLVHLAEMNGPVLEQTHRQELERLRQVHRKLSLTLADQHQQAKAQVQKLRKGNTALRGYAPPV